MFVSGPEGRLNGYAISQPATPLHFPPAHEIGATGVIDDYFHSDFADPNVLDGGEGAGALVDAAGGALHARGNGAAIAVCPAAWTSKIRVLEAAGYETAIVWYIKR